MSVSSISETVSEGAAARLELAEELASAFRSDPGSFEPRRLERLGRSGLACFLRHVGSAAPEAGLDAAPPSAGTRNQQRTAGRYGAAGWTGQRTSERHYGIAGTLLGLRAGAGTAAAGLLFLLLTERVLPLIERSLS
ncbi:hypothetical protein GRZ55_16535 [Chelativorans sp. ZYF759]|uniref:hypothetical protein n=1 Tax=Chelativorans sp. ZYF759 TaxID=2692213 RepID=UPI00145DCA3F|nr:hypothetical protein [Chelativorans sp. ZYF759]NMG40855.1 hypothetical protein [Chelativorans sp. ZYF759]